MPAGAETQPYGVDEFINLVLILIRFYLRHKPAIDNAIGTPLNTAMETIAEAYDSLKIMNPFGPQ